MIDSNAQKGLIVSNIGMSTKGDIGSNGRKVIESTMV